MLRTNERTRLWITAVAVWAALPGPFVGRPAAAATTIDIGVVSVFDFVADWMRAGAQFAVDDVNAAGGVLGRRLRLVFEQDSALGERGVRDLLRRGQIEALIGPE
ncbi:MAG: hypothetical protein ACRDJM_11180, partial [Actinomycetota bacterium]